MGDDEFQEGDNTKKVRLAVHDEMRTVKKIQFWATLALTVAACGFGAAMYLNRYAAAEDVVKLGAKQDDHVVKLSVLKEEVTAVKAVQDHIVEELHYQRAQLSEVAKAVHARAITPPRHEAHRSEPGE